MRDEGALLTIDRGNTTLDCVRRVAGIEMRRRLDPEDWQGLRAFVEPQPVVAVAATVVNGGLARVCSTLAQHRVPMWVAGVDLSCPLELRYPSPGSLGVDRWLGALAAQRRFGDAIVVDCGTALTVNLVTASGVFLGGAIAPGVATMAYGLSERAPSLPPAVWDGEFAAVPTNSATAVGFGVAVGFCGAVERLVDQLARLAGLDHATRVITGGDAPHYLRHSNRSFVPVPDLVHQGLRLLYCAHQRVLP